jgi:aconitate hydratase
VPLRSNVPVLSELVFEDIDPTFAQRARQAPNGTIVGGDNYGQGSARDHAALCPRYLAIRTVIAKSFARIHSENLINYGILPLVFSNPEDHRNIDRDDELQFEEVHAAIEKAPTMTVTNLTRRTTFAVELNYTERQRRILMEGGLLNRMRLEIRKKQASGR